MQIANAFIQYCTTQWGLPASSPPNMRGGGQTGSDMYECRLWKTNERWLVGGCWFYSVRYVISVTGNAHYDVFQCVHGKKKKNQATCLFFFLIWKPSLRPFGLLEQTIKDTLCRAHHHNPEPQVFMLCKTSLTISHVKQLLAHVTFSPLSFSQQFRSGVAAYYWINSI